MKIKSLFRLFSRVLLLLSLLSIGSRSFAQTSNIPLSVSFYYPTNGQTFTAPATIGVHALVLDSTLVDTVQYFADGTNIGSFTNSSALVFTNSSAGNPFEKSWSNVLAGTYTLTAVVTDAGSTTVTSAPVSITVLPPPPPPVIPLSVSFYYPTNGQTFTNPATIGVHALVLDSTLVDTVKYFANGTNIASFTNSSAVVLTNSSSGNPFEFGWSNILAGTYALTAVATDAGNTTVTSAPVNITVLPPPPPPPIPFAVSFWYPTNTETFTAPTNIGVHALVTDSNVVTTMAYYSGTTNIGIVTNTSGVLLTNTTSDNPFYLLWSNVLVGTYTLTAVATDSAGLMATSPPVTITVVPPVIRPTVYIYSPTNGAEYLAPADLTLYARAVESTGTIATVQFFAGSTSLGIVTNGPGVQVTNTAVSTEPLFPLGWSNVLAGSYALKVVATDTLGISGTSSVVTITVVTNFPPPPVIPLSVSFYYPTNGQTFTNPATIGVHALVLDSTLVDTVKYFANGTNIASFTNSSAVVLTNSSSGNPFEFGWSNVVAGTYALTAVVTDAGNTTVTSAPVNITVLPPPPPSPIPFAVSFWYPTNTETFTAPVNIGVHALVTDSNVVTTMAYFSGTTNIGIVTNTSGVLLTNTTSDSPFYLLWSNVLAGTYTLTAVATDSAGLMATSPPVTIAVLPPPPPPVVPLSVSFYYPTNGQTFTNPATIGVHAKVLDSTLVDIVQYFANGTNIASFTNSSAVVLTNSSTGNPFEFGWSNVLAGTYALTAVVTDAGNTTVTSAPVNITVLPPPPPPVIPLTVSFYYPTNGQTFTAPATIGVHAKVLDSTLVDTVQYFANGVSIGTRTNTADLVLTNSSMDNPFFLAWSNVLAGTYVLTAVATDAGNTSGTSAPVTITVLSPPPPPPIPFAVSFWYPTNGETFTAPVNIGVHALVTDSNLVTTMAYFSGTTNIGIVTNTSGILLTNTSTESPFYMLWSNVLAGTYTLTAVATDSAGLMATSPPVTITILPPPPPPVIPLTVSFYYPTNGQTFTAPATIGVHARVLDSTLVETVQYFANGVSIGTRTNTADLVLTNSSMDNPFFLAWSNVVADTYILTAVATDAGNTSVTSAPVTITVQSLLTPADVNVSPPLPVTILNPTSSGPHTVSFSFVTQSGSTHTVQYKDTVTAATWTTLTTISGNGSETNVVDTTATTPARIYRVITQ